MSANTPDRRFDSRLFLGGAVLAALGSALAAIGVALGSVAVIEAARRWQRSTEMTPAQLAKHALGTAQVARSAGAQAWRAPMPEPRRSPDGRRQPVS
jgi:hypothetical protein